MWIFSSLLYKVELDNSFSPTFWNECQLKMLIFIENKVKLKKNMRSITIKKMENKNKNIWTVSSLPTDASTPNDLAPISAHSLENRNHSNCPKSLRPHVLWCDAARGTFSVPSLHLLLSFPLLSLVPAFFTPLKMVRVRTCMCFTRVLATTTTTMSIMTTATTNMTATALRMTTATTTWYYESYEPTAGIRKAMPIASD